MANRLRDHPDDLDALVGLTAEHLGINAAYVEKDFWATEVLRAASRPAQVAAGEVRFLFKGGTSLSRIYRITERFSEDIDLLAEFPDGLGATARHRVLKSVDRAVSAHLGIDGVAGSSETGVKRYTRYRFPTFHHEGALSRGVLLELGSRGGTHPASMQSLRSMVADHAILELGEPDNTWAEFASFAVLTLAPERTLLEKLSAVHTLATESDEEGLLRSGRHFYDIAMLVQNEDVRAALRELAADGVARLADDIHQHSAEAGFRSVERPATGFADSSAFNPRRSLRPTIERAYAASMALVHGRRPSFEEMLAAVARVRHLL